MEPLAAFHQSPDGVPGFALAVLIMFGILAALIITAIKVLIYCKIFSKAGYSWALGLLMLVPVANIIMPFILAFGDWPIQKELRSLRQQQRSEA